MNPKATKLLVVEDEEEAAALLCEMLDAAGFQSESRVAASLEAGVGMIREWRPDAVILDLMLGDSFGIETFRAIRDAAEGIPVVVLTGHDDEELAVRSVQEGADDYLIKGGVDGRLLVRAVRYAMERAANRRLMTEDRARLEKSVSRRTVELSESNARLKAEVMERSRAESALRESNRMLEQALRDLKRTQQQVVQRERLHALGSMAGGVAHDINNALAPVMGFADLLLQKPEVLSDAVRVTRYLGLIKDCAGNAASVVRRLREFCRDKGSRSDFEPVSLNALVDAAVNLTRPLWRDEAMLLGVDIRVQTDLESIPPVMGDSAALQEVLTNLIFNSVDAIRSSGTITIRTRLRGDRALVQVADTGGGMSGEVRRRCMDPFFTTKAAPGCGFGLPTVFGIVEAHGGSIELESTSGDGTVVSLHFSVRPGVELPVIRSVESATGRKTGPEVRKEGPLHILVVDDEPLLREVVEVCLAADGHSVKTASDGIEGLAAFREEEFDLVITDRAMPGMSGDQLAREIKAGGTGVPVVMLTGFGDLMDASGNRVEGVEIILAKPFAVDALREAVESLRASADPRGTGAD